VDDHVFIWQIRKKPSYSAAIGESPLSVAIQLKDSNNSVLVVGCNGPRPDAWIKESEEIIVTPKHVAEIIKSAITKGWDFENKGSPFELQHEIT
jgi:hypothetical protein